MSTRKSFNNWPLKVKISFLFVTLTSVMLAAFAILTIDDFRKDKVAYAFETVKGLSTALARQIQTEIDFHNKQIHMMLWQKFSSNDTSNSHFYPYKYVWLYKWENSSRRYQLARTLAKSDNSEALKYSAALEKLKTEVQQVGIGIADLGETDQWLFGTKYDLGMGQKPLVVLTLVEGGEFLGAFHSSMRSNNYLSDHLGRVVLGPRVKAFNLDESEVDELVKINARRPSSFSQVYEESVGSHEDKWLVSVSEVANTSLKVLTLIPKGEVLKIVDLLWLKAALMMLLLIATTVFVSILGSHGLTLSLRRLLFGMNQVAAGNLETQVPVKSDDEVGKLTEGFNQMTNEIRHLMNETADKTRMEEELKTAQLVQSTLFPPAKCDHDDFSIRGYYCPASECSGDWWHYSEVGNKIYIWIGDATGHGVPAALVTTAAKSASAIMERIGAMPVDRVLSLLNTAVYETAQGQVNMTFFVGCIDRETGVLTCSNASHDPPFLLPSVKRNENFSKKDIEILGEIPGPRLGQNQHSTYNVQTVQLKPGDQILLYTDGITELVNPEGNMWKERRLLKTLIESARKGQTIDETMITLDTNLQDFRRGAPLEDDVTYFMFQYKDVG